MKTNREINQLMIGHPSLCSKFEAINFARKNRDVEIWKILISRPDICFNDIVSYIKKEGSWTLWKILLSDPRVSPKDALLYGCTFYTVTKWKVLLGRFNGFWPQDPRSDFWNVERTVFKRNDVQDYLKSLPIDKLINYFDKYLVFEAKEILKQIITEKINKSLSESIELVKKTSNLKLKIMILSDDNIQEYLRIHPR